MNTSIDYRELALQAYRELTGQPGSDLAPPEPPSTSLDAILAEIAPLPQGALFLGVAVDGLPVLLDMGDPAPGPLLIVSDSGTGKTNLLQIVAHTASLLSEPGEIQFGILTTQPGEWQYFTDLPHCAGVYSVQDPSTHEFLSSLNTWARQKRQTDQAFLLIIDDLTQAEALSLEDRQTLRWLLVRGPSHSIWPLVTLNTGLTEQVLPWLAAFRTRMLGTIDEQEQAEILAGAAQVVPSLNKGQFALREGRGWLKFWVPDLDE